ncbi:MAG TPA: hypothetical protein VKB87_01910 [Myxococcaceae bacterium]|nr:hypothetical protein [Myxococcaceae bacterium]
MIGRTPATGTPIRLGELLVHHRVITEAQLAEALKAQQLFGGRIGTNLVELGYVSEQGLTKFLSTQLKIPAIDSRELDAIPSDALAALPLATVEKYRVVPLSISGRKLRVATADPTDLTAIDEICFTTGLTITPHIAPELLITYALEKYYGVARPLRYVRVIDSPDAQAELLSNDFPTPAPIQPSSGYDLRQASKDLAELTQSQGVFAVLKRFAEQDFKRAILFVVRGQRVMGWDQIGCPIAKSDLRLVSLDPADNPLLTRALRSPAAFVGNLPADQLGEWLVSQLQLEPDRAVFALSVAVHHQPVILLLSGSPKNGELAGQLDLYQALGAKVSHSLQMVSLRKKILES